MVAFLAGRNFFGKERNASLFLVLSSFRRGLVSYRAPLLLLGCHGYLDFSGRTPDRKYRGWSLVFAGSHGAQHTMGHAEFCVRTVVIAAYLLVTVSSVRRFLAFPSAVIRRERTILSVAHRRNSIGVDSIADQHRLHRIGASKGQLLVSLRVSGVVSVSVQLNLSVRVCLQCRHQVVDRLPGIRRESALRWLGRGFCARRVRRRYCAQRSGGDVGGGFRGSPAS